MITEDLFHHSCGTFRPPARQVAHRELMQINKAMQWIQPRLMESIGSVIILSDLYKIINIHHLVVMNHNWHMNISRIWGGGALPDGVELPKDT
jgi:hypothetical protein